MNEQTLRGLIRNDMEEQTPEERIERLYSSMMKDLVNLENCGASLEEIDLAATLVYRDRRQRRADPIFRMPSECELKSIFDALEQDATTEPLLTWTAKNLNRFSRFVTSDAWTHDTLTDLMEARFEGVRDRNPLILRAVIEFALAEYICRGYDPESLHRLFEKLPPPPVRPDE
ncbi:MAG: hypothetical protein H0X47_09165 [Nitrospirales bacterium]|nr:hypothetical protein [Nitrospirales bacterium]